MTVPSLRREVQLVQGVFNVPGWIKLNYFTELKTHESWSEQRYAKNFDLSWDSIDDKIERINVKDVSPDEFIKRFEAPYKPVVIHGVQDEWQALNKWTLEVNSHYILKSRCLICSSI